MLAARKHDGQLVDEVDSSIGVGALAIPWAWVIAHESFLLRMWERSPSLVETKLEGGVVAQKSEK